MFLCVSNTVDVFMLAPKAINLLAVEAFGIILDFGRRVIYRRKRLILSLLVCRVLVVLEYADAMCLGLVTECYRGSN